MDVSPQKISFQKSMRGYHVQQVDAYIESLRNELATMEEEYQSRIAALEKKIEQLQKELAVCHMTESEKTPLRKKAAQRRFGGMRSHPTLRNRGRTERFFAACAAWIRIIGKTGCQISRVVAALPSPEAKAASETAAAPNSVKDAKQLLKVLTEQEKAARKVKKQEKKINKIRRRIEKKQDTLLKKA